MDLNRAMLEMILSLLGRLMNMVQYMLDAGERVVESTRGLF